MFKFKAINTDNIRDVHKFESSSVDDARKWVLKNLDSKTSWAIFEDNDD